MYGNIPMELRKPNIKWTSDWINFGLGWPHWFSFEKNGQLEVLDLIIIFSTFKQTVKVSKSYFYALSFYGFKIVLDCESKSFCLSTNCFGRIQFVLVRLKSFLKSFWQVQIIKTINVVQKSLIWTWSRPQQNNLHLSKTI